MWSSVGELYPIYFSPVLSSPGPPGQVKIIEPTTEIMDYYQVKPPGKPYEILSYSTRKWVI